MPKVYAIDGIVPVVDSTAFVHASAVLIGDVIVGPHAYIGPVACLRGDCGRIVIDEGTNIQDTCMLHGFPGKDTVVGPEVTVGHGAVLHGCVVKRGALLGMNCVVNDNAEVGEDAIVAALAFVKAEAHPGTHISDWHTGKDPAGAIGTNLSDFLCVRHNMVTKGSRYAEHKEEGFAGDAGA